MYCIRADINNLGLMVHLDPLVFSKTSCLCWVATLALRVALKISVKAHIV